MILFESDRNFWVKEYRTDQGLLLIRSPKYWYGEKSFPDNIDLIFTGVSYMEFGMGFLGLTIETATEEEWKTMIHRVPPPRAKLSGIYYVLRDEDGCGCIAADALHIERNTLRAWESSLGMEHR